MRRLFIAAAIGIYIAAKSACGYCEIESSFSDSESRMGQNLETEINTESAQNTSEQSEANSEFASTNTMSL